VRLYDELHGQLTPTILLDRLHYVPGIFPDQVSRFTCLATSHIQLGKDCSRLNQVIIGVDAFGESGVHRV